MKTGTSTIELTDMTSPVPGRYYLLGLLWLTYTFSVLDRYVMGILVEPIKRDLGVSDSMMGFLSGTVFGLFYATLAIPVAMLADRSNRRNVVAASLFIWSLCTMFCGMANNALQLALARIFVGVGEAGSTPPAQSLIADLFPPSERGKAVGLFASGGSLGMVLAFTLSGLIAGEWGWRWAFIVLGAPGIVLALLLMVSTREPVRGQTDPTHQSKADAVAPPFAEVMRFVLGNRGLVHLIASLILTTTSGTVLALWVPAYLIRNFHISEAQLGPALGLVIGVAGMIGAIVVGWVSDRVARRHPSRRVLVGAVMQMLVWPCMVAVLLSGNYVTALWLLVIPGFFIYAPVAVGWAIMQNITPPRMRATTIGIGVLVANIGALVIGPQLVGLASDLLANGDATTGLRNALLLSGLFYPWAAWHYLRATALLKH
ncbi:spinster family MFS transporter [Pseudomonas fluorescens]|uniref:Putative glucarate transporter n=1 Tax=Pseudomonas fluorescens TaxID=294 RepID=A0A5E7AST4_PSEFL|nr:MFS transporter [Pseudomonas fluorescens]VVN82176.1 putative glucarate transporter [Pseudomonas fluorescens]